MTSVYPSVVGHLVVVVGLSTPMTWKISKIRKHGANQEPTNYEQLSYTLPVLIYWSTFGFNANFGFTVVYVTFVYCNFLGMRIGPNWYGLGAGQVYSMPTPKVR